MIITGPDFNEIRERLRGDEGYRGLVYDDATGRMAEADLGRLTIGYGANIQDVPISRWTAEIMLTERLLTAVGDALALCPTLGMLSPQRQHVLIEMAYQLGRSRLGSFRRMLRAVDDRDFHRAALEIMDSQAARDHPNRFTVHEMRMREG